MSRASDQAYQHIRQAILAGEFAPEARLKEEDLVQMCGVSRTPVREALRRLAAEDYVIIQRNQGAQVKAWSRDDREELFALRALLEGYAARRAATRIQPEQLAHLQQSITAMDAVLAGSEAPAAKNEAFLRLNRDLHETIWNAAGSARLESMLRHLVEQALVARTAQHFSLTRIAESHHHHRDLVQALAVGDETWAEAVMRGHIRAALASLEASLQDDGAPTTSSECIQSAPKMGTGG